jgi:hypothetical protein
VISNNTYRRKRLRGIASRHFLLVSALSTGVFPSRVALARGSRAQSVSRRGSSMRQGIEEISQHASASAGTTARRNLGNQTGNVSANSIVKIRTGSERSAWNLPIPAVRYPQNTHVGGLTSSVQFLPGRYRLFGAGITRHDAAPYHGIWGRMGHALRSLFALDRQHAASP